MSFDLFHLQWFVQAPAGHGAGDGTYAEALAAMHRSGKQSHWMWYVFPIPYKQQSSPMSSHYAT